MIRVEHISKRYGAHTVVDDVTLAIEPGRCLALLGHNGAGKTTLIKMILGLARPSAGAITVPGGKPGNNLARRQIGFLPENVAFHPLLTGRETLVNFVRLKRAARSETGRLLERTGLDDAADRPVGTYSKGMRQRLGLAQALIGEPQVLLLDEPTTGLDPMLRRSFYEIIDELKRAGTSVVLSSHALTELETRTDSVAIMRMGRFVVEGSLADLRRQAALPVRIRLRSDSVEHILASMGGRRMNGRAMEISCHQEDKVAVIRRLAGMSVEIDDFELAQPSLDEIYAHYGGFGEAS